MISDIEMTKKMETEISNLINETECSLYFIINEQRNLEFEEDDCDGYKACTLTPAQAKMILENIIEIKKNSHQGWQSGVMGWGLGRLQSEFWRQASEVTDVTSDLEQREAEAKALHKTLVKWGIDVNTLPVGEHVFKRDGQVISYYNDGCGF